MWRACVSSPDLDWDPQNGGVIGPDGIQIPPEVPPANFGGPPEVELPDVGAILPEIPDANELQSLEEMYNPADAYEHQANVTAHLRDTCPGCTIGEQVTLDVSNLETGDMTTIVIDNTVLEHDHNRVLLADAKFSGVHDLTNPDFNLNNTLTPNQKEVFGWLADGDDLVVVPRGQKAIAAGLVPNQEIDIAGWVEILVNGPNGVENIIPF